VQQRLAVLCPCRLDEADDERVIADASLLTMPISGSRRRAIHCGSV